MDVFSCQGSPPCNKDNSHFNTFFLGLVGKGLLHSTGPWPFAHLSEALDRLKPDAILGNLGLSFDTSHSIDGANETARRLEHMRMKTLPVSRMCDARECLRQNSGNVLEARHYANRPSATGIMGFSRSITQDDISENFYDSALVRGTVKGVHTCSGICAAHGAEETRTLTSRIDAERSVPVNYDMPRPSNRSQSASVKPKKKSTLEMENPWEYGFSKQPLPNMVSGRQALQHKSIKPLLELFSADVSRPSASCKLTLKKLPLRTSQMQFKIVTQESVDGKIGMLEKRKKRAKAARKGRLQCVHVLKQLLCGGAAGVISRTVVAPLDLIKTYLITSHGLQGSQKSALAVCKEIVGASGWQGLFRGNVVNCIRVAPSKAIELCVFEMVRRELNKEGHPLKHAAATIAGGAAGMAGTSATYPLELIRTRLSVQPELYTGIVQAISKIFQEEGFMAFYSGLSPSLLGVFPYAATNYFLYDGLRAAYRRSTGLQNVPIIPTLAFGAVAAATSSTVTYPLEVARRQMQLSLTDTMKKSSVRIILDIYERKGFLAVYRGLGTTWLKLIPAAGISFVCYEAARLALCIDDASVAVNAKEASIPVDEESGM